MAESSSTPPGIRLGEGRLGRRAHWYPRRADWTIRHRGWLRVLALGAWLHGRAADTLIEDADPSGILAGDVARALPYARFELLEEFAEVPEEFITHSAEETTAWGREFAERLRPPMLILLSGDLGSGKTTLTKGIVSALGAAREEDVHQPDVYTAAHLRRSRSRFFTAIFIASSRFTISKRWVWKTF